MPGRQSQKERQTERDQPLLCTWQVRTYREGAGERGHLLGALETNAILIKPNKIELLVQWAVTQFLLAGMNKWA